MRRTCSLICTLLALLAPLWSQEKRMWVLRSSGDLVEYDASTFAVTRTVKLPPEAAKSPQAIAVNHQGQVLFAPQVSLPLADSDLESPRKVWFWDGQKAVSIELGVKREVAATGSNQAITETVPAVYLSADGTRLFWFANEQRRLQREGVDLSVTTSWQAWQTDLAGGARQDLITTKLPECRCKTGACEETCPYGAVWAPDEGVADFFALTQFVAAKDGPAYKASTLYHESAGKWTESAVPQPLQRVLDAAPGGASIVEAIPDTGCCGWSNQSNDQVLVIAGDKAQTIFDEQATFKNTDYDVSFYAANARLSPGLDSVAMTIVATAKANQPIQLAEDGQANPEESKQIRKALADLPALEVKSLGESARRVAYLPHATVVGWINEKELLIVEDHLLIVFDVARGARRKSSIRVEDAARVFLR